MASRKQAGRAPAKREEPNGQPPAAATPPGLEPFMAGLGGDTNAVTTVEWVRAAAEVRAHVMAAHEWPRDEEVCETRLRRSCGHLELARRAFYSYERGGKLIAGPTIGLMREAMRCWGNMGAGMWELRRSVGGSEQMAWCVDWETNARFAQTFWTPHLREKGTGALLLEDTEARDIYEVNTSAAAKRLREQIKHALPPWFVALAEAECERTLQAMVGGEAVPFATRLGKALKLYAELGVPEAALVKKLDAPRSAWGRIELQTLLVTYQGIVQGELRKERVFDLGAEEGAEAVLAAAAKAKAAPEPPADPPGGPSAPAAPAATTGPGATVPPPAGQEAGDRDAAELRQAATDAIAGLFHQAGWAAHTRAHGLVRRGMIVLLLTGDPAAGEAPAEFDSVTLEGLSDAQVTAVMTRLAAFVSSHGKAGELHGAMGREVQAAVDALGDGGGEE